MTDQTARHASDGSKAQVGLGETDAKASGKYSLEDVPQYSEAEETVTYETDGYGYPTEQYTTEQVFQEQIYMDEPRRVELTVARIDPWSALKLGFLLSIALGIATVVDVVLLWFVLDGMNVFGSVETFLIELNAERFLALMDYVRLPRVVSYATMLGVANVVIFTALSALIALLYNLIAALVGGIRVSLLDEFNFTLF